MDKIYEKAVVLGVAPYMSEDGKVVGAPSEEIWFTDTTRKIKAQEIKANTIVFIGELPLEVDWKLEIVCRKALIKNKAILDDLSGNPNIKIRTPHIVIAYENMKSDPILHNDSIVEKVYNMLLMKDVDNNILKKVEVDISKFTGGDEELASEVRRVLTYNSKAPRYCEVYELEALKEMVKSICIKPELMTPWIEKHMEEINIQLAIKKNK